MVPVYLDISRGSILRNKKTELCNEVKCQCRFVFVLLIRGVFMEFVTLKDLIYHLKSVHNKCITIEEKRFTLLLSWKDDEEKKGNSSYVQECGPQTSVLSSAKRFYYSVTDQGKVQVSRCKD